jgi:hypothetical protein
MLRPLVCSLAGLVLVGAAVAACGTSAANTPSTASVTSPPTPAPSAAPASAPSETTQPVAPSPSTDGVGPEYVTGTGTFQVVDSGTSTQVGDVTQLRGVTATSVGTMNDPRVNGASTLRFSMDSHELVGVEWGTLRIENAAGAWEGTISGAAWSDGNASDLSGWLVGSGDYAGFTYYVHSRSTTFNTVTEGIIFPGEPPKA